jgi:hypothetical protein
MANTATQLGQYALNVAVAVQEQIITGQVEGASKGLWTTVFGCIILLAEAVIVINNSSTGGGTIPNALITGKYSATQPSTTAIQV